MSRERPQPKGKRSAPCFCPLCEGRIRDHRTIKRHTSAFGPNNEFDFTLSERSINTPSNGLSWKYTLHVLFLLVTSYNSHDNSYYTLFEKGMHVLLLL